jgi:hypothetical protein
MISASGQSTAPQPVPRPEPAIKGRAGAQTAAQAALGLELSDADVAAIRGSNAARILGFGG